MDIKFQFDGERPPDDIVRFTKIKYELDNESERGAAIVAAAYVDLALEQAIKARLTDRARKNRPPLLDAIMGNYGPLGSFSAKIDMAFALGLIRDHSHDDLHIIRDIRNDFAHNLDGGSDPGKGLHFEDQSVAARCSNLWFPQNDYYAKNAAWLREAAKLDTARGKYIFACLRISANVNVLRDWWSQVPKPQQGPSGLPIH